MRAYQDYSHRFGREAIAQKGLLEEIYYLTAIPDIGITKGSSGRINEAIQDKLSESGWVLNPTVQDGFNLTVNAIKHRVTLMVQTGNAARAIYDLMKFQVMHLNNRVDAGVLIVPTAEAARVIGDNLANFTRLTKELVLFQHIITVPVLIIAIDE